jgi:CotH protein.
MLLLSCDDNAERISDLEKELEILKEDAEKQQNVVLLLNASNEKKQIVSAKKETALNSAVYWNISFTDNTKIEIIESVITSLSLNESTKEYTITLFDGKEMKFNSREIIYPTGLVALTLEKKYMKNTEISIEFRVNPSNAIFNYDVNSAECQIQLDIAGKQNTYSYVTNQGDCYLTRIEQVKDAAGNVKEGQYKAYIRDKNGYNTYKYNTALVLSTVDKNGDDVQLSSSAIYLERKRDTGLPIVVINTENNAEILDKENWIPGKMTIDGINIFDDYEGTITIRGRGNSTWAYPKKPFAIKLDTKSQILGMPSHKRWVLLANYIDRTLMRNHIAFEISKSTDLEWTSRGEYVEVMLNDIHLGNYYLCEHIKVDKNRVNIVEMKSTDLDDESITGGYLIEMDSYYDEVNKFKSEIRDLPVMLKEPEEDVLQPQQFEYIQNYINSIEQLFYSKDFALSDSYKSLIDENSFIDWWFVHELTFNYEANAPRSSYVHKNRSEVLKAGPVWDFDAWGTFTKQNTFAIKDALWYDALFKNPTFVAKVKKRWSLLKPSFENVVTSIDETGKLIYVSTLLNDEMWSLNGQKSANDDEDLSHKYAVEKMKDAYLYRLNWLDEQIQRLK